MAGLGSLVLFALDAEGLGLFCLFWALKPSVVVHRFWISDADIMLLDEAAEQLATGEALLSTRVQGPVQDSETSPQLYRERVNGINREGSWGQSMS